MRWRDCLAVSAALLIAGSVHAVPLASLRENYQTIVERNPFGLKPLPPPPTNNVAEAPKDKPKVDIYLTGITSVGYPKEPKRAYFFTKEQGKKEDPVFYSVVEGRSEGGYTVLSIDQVKRQVRLRTAEGETLLSFETHGLSMTNAAAVLPRPAMLVPGQPGAPGIQPVPLPAPGSAPAGQAVYNNQPTYGTPGAQPGSTPNVNTTSGGIRQIPSRNVRTRTPVSQNPGGDYIGTAPSPSPGAQQPQADQPVDLAEQYLRMHLNRAAKEREGVPMPPLPPAH